MNYKEIDSGNKGPVVLLSAGVHGDEYEPMLAVQELIEELPAILSKGVVRFVAVVNESAYESASRYGADGHDLARICPGNSLGTSSEIAAAGISKLIKNADYFVDMHTGGVMYDIAPLAGYMLHPSEVILEKQRKMAIAFNLSIVWGTDYLPEGRTLSVARDADIPSIYLEFGGGTGVRMQVVKAYKDGFINMLRCLEMIDWPVIERSEKDLFWVEDSRPDSGYLQGKMPSPADGIFVADVTLGKMIEKGQRWGRIINPLDGSSINVFADISGLVFLKRVLVKVKKGDALGGILPILESGKKVTL